MFRFKLKVFLTVTALHSRQDELVQSVSDLKSAAASCARQKTGLLLGGELQKLLTRYQETRQLVLANYEWRIRAHAPKVAELEVEFASSAFGRSMIEAATSLAETWDYIVRRAEHLHQLAGSHTSP